MRDEQGMVTATVVIFTVTLLAVAGLVFDGGNLLTAKRRAINEAEAAARAGAQALDLSSLRGGGVVVVDPIAAEDRAKDYLARVGHEGTVSVEGATVRVEVSFVEELSILGAFGLDPRTVKGVGVARAVRGIQEGDDA